jgi:hypothetical protein
LLFKLTMIINTIFALISSKNSCYWLKEKSNKELGLVIFEQYAVKTEERGNCFFIMIK